VRWELDYRGFQDIKLFVSGGLDEYSIGELVECADAFGVGTSISNAPVIDFSFDIVEIEGKPIAKRGKMSGAKCVYRCNNCFNWCVVPLKKDIARCKCGGTFESLLLHVVKKGEIQYSPPPPAETRDYVLEQLQGLEL
jgi:nicotinate phosphoribosyltransferase